MHVQIAIQVIISGIMLGAIYSLLAMGLTLIYGVVQIVNFAHGEFLMIGMFITFWLWSLLSGLDPLFSLVVVTPSLFLFGVIVYRFFFARVVN
jgi:branched-chain amino acid transport system permease protein